MCEVVHHTESTGRRVRSTPHLLMVATLLAGCVSQEQAVTPINLPTRAELDTYVRENWDVFSPRVSRAAFAEEGRPALVGVRDPICQYYLGDPRVVECSFHVRLADPESRERDEILWTQFERDTLGRLNETLVVIEFQRQ